MRLRCPASLHFGVGAIDKVGAVAAECNVSRALVVTDPGVAAAGHAERVAETLRASGLDATMWTGACPNPDRMVVEQCAAEITGGSYDAVVAVGGGSVIDVAKAAAALAACGGRLSDWYGLNRITRAILPLIAVPTTAGSGSEVSSHAVINEPDSRKKEVISGLPVLPRAVIVDPAATLTLPREVAVPCALDGLIHAIEAFVARNATPFTDPYAQMAIPMILEALPQIASHGDDLVVRTKLSLGCLYAGIAMANANAGIIHALGYPLTSEYGIPHGLANALVAPAALDVAWHGAPERYAELARLFGGANPMGVPETLAPRLSLLMYSFLEQVGVDLGLEHRGLAWADLDRLALMAFQFRPVLENTPYQATSHELRLIYQAAWLRPSALPAPETAGGARSHQRGGL